jgi:hypothetical protein
MHTAVILLYQLYRQTNMYENDGGRMDLFFTFPILIYKAVGGVIASFPYFNDKRTQMLVCSISAGFGLMIMMP